MVRSTAEKKGRKTPIGKSCQHGKARNVVERAFVPTGNGKDVVRNVMVEGCARRHIVQPKKVTLSIKDIVLFALFICFLPSEWRKIIGRRRLL